jgi:hypothetical protein
MKIVIPENLKNNYWDRVLYLSGKNKDSFLVLTEEEKSFLDKKLKELDKNPDSSAFNRFILAGIIRTKSVNNVLELPKEFEEFSKVEVSFSFERNSVLVSKS